MNANSSGLDFEVDEIAKRLDRLDSRGKATIFGVCGQALVPLLVEVEEKTEGKYALADIFPALELIEAFATGPAEAADHSELRARLMNAMPHGDTLDAPWSTYVQDALICVDAALAAASLDTTLKSIWIEYALEPLLVSMQIRDVEMIRAYGMNCWSRKIVDDPTLSSAMSFLRRAIEKILTERIDGSGFALLAREAAILRRVDL